MNQFTEFPEFIWIVDEFKAAGRKGWELNESWYYGVKKFKRATIGIFSKDKFLDRDDLLEKIVRAGIKENMEKSREWVDRLGKYSQEHEGLMTNPGEFFHLFGIPNRFSITFTRMGKREGYMLSFYGKD